MVFRWGNWKKAPRIGDYRQSRRGGQRERGREWERGRVRETPIYWITWSDNKLVCTFKCVCFSYLYMCMWPVIQIRSTLTTDTPTSKQKILFLYLVAPVIHLTLSVTRTHTNTPNTHTHTQNVLVSIPTLSSKFQTTQCLNLNPFNIFITFNLLYPPKVLSSNILLIFRILILFWVTSRTGLYVFMPKTLILPSAAALYSPSAWNTLFKLLSL